MKKDQSISFEKSLVKVKNMFKNQTYKVLLVEGLIESILNRLSAVEPSLV